MRAELPVLSFICVTILTIILCLKLRRSSVANLTIVGWLLACNLLHAINSIVWSNNVAIKIPAWCDIGRFNAIIVIGLFRSFPQSRKSSSVQMSHYQQHVSVYCVTWTKSRQSAKPHTADSPRALTEPSTPHCVSCFPSFTFAFVGIQSTLKYFFA
jgi:hypothetical protein